MTVRELLNRIDSSELTEWAAFYSLEPFGDFRSDMQAGIIASTIANCNRSKHSKTFKPIDFMPLVKEEPKQMSGDEIKNVLKAMAEEQNNKRK